jgi:hypothetical protein
MVCVVTLLAMQTSYCYNHSHLPSHAQREEKYEGASEFLATDPEVPGSIPGATRFSEKVVGLERGPLSLLRIIEELFQGNSGSGLEN